ncbi:MAG TPA: ATP-binding protein [Janthinobacterium sp.]|nr:ATP-binding protein [Janthinobacterium sp.]
MAKHDRDEEMLVHSAAMRNANSVLLARHQAEQEINEAREALRRSNERMSNVLESITDGFTVLDKSWHITYINARAANIIRPDCKDGDNLIGKNLWEEFPELRGTVLEARYRYAMECQDTVGFELYYLPLKRWLEVRAYPSSEGLTSYIQDITQRKNNERALSDGAKRLRVALSAGQLGDWSWDAATDLVTLGWRAAGIFEVLADTPVSWSALRARLLDEEGQAAHSRLLLACSTRANYAIECRVQRSDGEWRWLSIIGEGNYGADLSLQGMTGVVQDITVRKAAEDTLRQSEEELRALANAIPQLAWIAHFDGTVTWYNERWYQYTGTTPEQVAGKGWQTVYDPECIPQIMLRWQESLRSGHPFEMEFPILGADGQFRWFLTRANPVRDSGGRLLRWFGTSTDVDQVKRAQEALRDETKVLELLNSTGTALASTLDLRTLLQEVTDAATGISGARYGAFFYSGTGPDGAVLNRHTLSGAALEQFAHFDEPRATDLLGPSQRGEGPIRLDDVCDDPHYGRNMPYFCMPPGHPPVRSYMAVPVISRSGEVIGCLLFGHPEPGIFTARTERIVGSIAAQAAIAIDNTRMYEAAQQAAEERKILLDSERSAREEAERTSQMKDEFLATLSHELRTPLSAILGWAQVLRRGTRDEADLHRGLQTIERNARAQAQLIEDLLDMSRITSGKVLLEMQSMTPASVIDAAIEALRPAAEVKNIRLERDIAPDAGLIAGDPSRLQQVFWNLLSNALKFTPRDGTVKLSAHRVDDQVEIAIRDNGIGIKAEFLAHVFERFRQADASTTRKHGGLGLGLAIVKQLVEQHGGTVRAASAGEGRGACFTVQLPLAQAQGASPLRPAPQQAPAAPPLAGDMTLRDLSGMKVLVVDDEADARNLIKRILNDCQAEVCTAGSAAQALQLLLTEHPDVLVSDIGMPDIDGFELLTLIRALGPAKGGDLPAVALTAFARSDDRKRALDSGFLAHIAKPVEPSQLIATVANLARNERH